MASNRNIALTAVLLGAVILFFGLSDADLWVQNFFYRPQTGTWLVDGDDPLWDLLFYSGLKKVLIVVSALLLLALISAYRHPLIRRHRRGLSILVLSVIIVPAIVNGLKAVTNMPCPKNLEIYGGQYPHTCVWEKYPSDFCQAKKIKCWPAGHASGGFALMSLVFLFRSQKGRRNALAFGIGMGWIMGTYKMVIGDHFLSHTVITMVMGWLIILLIVRLVDTIAARRQVND